jgi:hypothetical protein
MFIARLRSKDGSVQEMEFKLPTWRLERPWLVTVASRVRDECPLGGSVEVVERDTGKRRYSCRKDEQGNVTGRYVGGKPT